MDTGKHKVGRFNILGIPELREENISQANCLQRAGRAGRTKPGIYIRANDTPFEDLPAYPEAPMEREMLEKYLLILLAHGMDIVAMAEEASQRGEQLFFHEFDKRLLGISLHRLRKIGAIDGSRTITALGKDLVKLPLDVYNARMLYESIRRNCLEDMIYATAILEKKGFVSKNGTWKSVELAHSDESDLFAFVELFKLVTTRTLDERQKSTLLDLGIAHADLARFAEHEGKYGPLYETVDLSHL